MLKPNNGIKWKRTMDNEKETGIIITGLRM